MMEAAHDHPRFRSAAALASAWNALCRMSAIHSWLWLVRSAPLEAAPTIGLVLFDGLSSLLDALGAEALGHG
ncbi:hypothetical protein BVIR_1235 [Blastochloris viridis]|uniref:Uncharacterized protein n=1 Tax=Blastochloris viridis TaxID=1079 RepID=A0A0P0JFI4_BLAVI|nr:hypothetical protein BVIR_1235 [Blastochloris viridis]CUU41686.1 hypothetical protein BVIRIDIS_06790 [Blastochloris viridis]